MKKEKNNNNKRNGKDNSFRVTLTARILSVSLIPTLVMALVLTIVAAYSIKDGMSSEALSSLEELTTSVVNAYNAVDSGDYSISKTDDLIKGSLNVTKGTGLLDGFTDGNDADVTIYYDDTRYATSLIDSNTGDRMLGTQGDKTIYNAVVTNGETVSRDDLDVNGVTYYGCYTPLKDSTGIVGMIFVGKPATDINKYINEKMMLVFIFVVVIGIIAVVGITWSAMSIKKGIVSAKEAVVGLADGKLNITINERGLGRNDELGDMIRGINLLKNELYDVVSHIKESSAVLSKAGDDLSNMSAQTSSTADEIGHAVEDISKGAVSQAEEIENASNKVEVMGNVIESIVSSVDTLDETSGSMKKAGDKAIGIIKDLTVSNDKTMDAIDRIGEQVEATNESANKISEAIQLITSIAEETNLLSLNASIEAARAGEQGRGFAVVANQIQKLAEQSNESARRIDETVKSLLEDSENTVNVMGEVRGIVNEQQEKLTDTRSQFKNVYSGIDQSRTETEDIKGQTGTCDEARVNVVDIISNLSAISEENAASTQETTASMEELNATINILAESAGNLQELSTKLANDIEFFEI